MAVSKVKVDESHHRLMLAIGEAIRVHTSASPMTLESISGVLAFCSGAAIGRGEAHRSRRRQLREMAVANVDSGMLAMTNSLAAASSLILPETMQ